MSIEKTKHSFVDDHPYIAYAGEPDTAVDGSGTGTDAPGALIVHSNGPAMSTWSSDYVELSLDVDIPKIVDAVLAGTDVIIYVRFSDKRIDANFNCFRIHRVMFGPDLSFINGIEFVNYDVYNDGISLYKLAINNGPYVNAKGNVESITW